MAKLSFDDGDGVWRTIGGRRVFIRTGQSLSDAMKESGKFKSAKKKNEVKDENKSFTRDELKEKYGTDDTDLINAGKEKDDRVELKDERANEYKQELNEVQKNDAKTYMQDQFKAFDKGDISGEELEQAKKDSGLSKVEIENARNYVNERATENYSRQTENKTGNTTSQPVPKEKGNLRLKEYLAKNQPEGAKFSKMLEESNVKTFADEIKEQNKIETISKAEYDKMPNDYKGTLKELVNTAEFRGENKQDLIKQYEKLGYDVNKDKTILVNEKGGTVLKPVKINDELKEITSKNDNKTIKQLNDEMLGDTYKGKGNTPNLIYSNNRRIDIANNENGGKTATIWKDGKIERKTNLPENVKGDKTKDYFDKYLKELDNSNAKSTNETMNNVLRRKAYQKYLREHPASKITFEDFKDMRNINK